MTQPAHVPKAFRFNAGQSYCSFYMSVIAVFSRLCLLNVMKLLMSIRMRCFTYARCLRKTVARLIGCYGGAVDSIISVNTQLHWSSYDLEFEISFESI